MLNVTEKDINNSDGEIIIDETVVTDVNDFYTPSTGIASGTTLSKNNVYFITTYNESSAKYVYLPNNFSQNGDFITLSVDGTYKIYIYANGNNINGNDVFLFTMDKGGALTLQYNTTVGLIVTSGNYYPIYNTFENMTLRHLWIADLGVTLSGNLVTQWNDLKDSANLTAPNNKPVYLTNRRKRASGVSAIGFNIASSNNEYMTAGASFVNFLPMTLMVNLAIHTSMTKAFIISKYRSGANNVNKKQFSLMLEAGNIGLNMLRDSNADNFGTGTTFSDLKTTRPYSFSTTYSTGTNNTFVDFSYDLDSPDTVSMGGNSFTPTSATAEQFMVGTIFKNDGNLENYCFRGEIADIAIYENDVNARGFKTVHQHFRKLME